MITAASRVAVLFFAILLFSAQVPVPSPVRAPAAAPPTKAKAAAAGPVGPCCPNQSAYEAAVRAFAAGNRGPAAVAILHAPAKQLEHAVGKLKATDQMLVRSAAAMHIVLAAIAVDANNFGAVSLQLNAADTAARKIHRPPDNPTFLGTWYAAAAGVCLAAGGTDAATAYVEQGLEEQPGSATLLLIKGVLDETAADADARVAATHLADDDVLEMLRRRGVPGPAKGDHSRLGVFGRSVIVGVPQMLFSDRAQRRRVTVDLGDAETGYRQALRADATSIEAKLRLGRVLALEHKDAEARSTLQAVLEASHDARVVYLAHLFLADLAVRRKDTATAVREYTAATAANPAGATAYIALSNLALTSGDERRASGDIAAWRAHAATNTADPWLAYQRGLDDLQPTLEALLGMLSP